MRRSGRDSGLFGVLAGAIPVAIAVGLVLFAVWRWRSAQAASPAVATGAGHLPARRPLPGPERAPATGSGAGSLADGSPASGSAGSKEPHARSDRPRGRIDDVLARAREEDEAAK